MQAGGLHVDGQAFVHDLDRFHRDLVARCLERRPFDLVDEGVLRVPPQNGVRASFINTMVTLRRSSAPLTMFMYQAP
jgi:hypothetical protein